MWTKMTQFVLSMVDVINLSETGAHVSVTMYGERAEVSICEARNISTIQNGLDKINNITRFTSSLGSPSDIVTALNVSLYKMFSHENCGRKNVPKTLILLTDGDCKFCKPNNSDFNSSYKTYLTDIVEQFNLRKIRVILISTRDNYALIEETYQVAITGEDNFHLIQRYDELLNSDFIYNTSVCDGMFSLKTFIEIIFI